MTVRARGRLFVGRAGRAGGAGRNPVPWGPWGGGAAGRARRAGRGSPGRAAAAGEHTPNGSPRKRGSCDPPFIQYACTVCSMPAAALLHPCGMAAFRPAARLLPRPVACGRSGRW
nr:hypothetical protein RVX_1707 [Nitratidesulfovibrio sp. HK-II]